MQRLISPSPQANLQHISTSACVYTVCVALCLRMGVHVGICVFSLSLKHRLASYP